MTPAVTTSPNPKEGHMNRKAMVCALSLLICGVALIPEPIMNYIRQHVPIKLS